jgi:hypothetical protein
MQVQFYECYSCILYPPRYQNSAIDRHRPVSLGRIDTPLKHSLSMHGTITISLLTRATACSS